MHSYLFFNICYYCNTFMHLYKKVTNSVIEWIKLNIVLYPHLLKVFRPQKYSQLFIVIKKKFTDDLNMDTWWFYSMNKEFHYHNTKIIQKIRGKLYKNNEKRPWLRVYIYVVTSFCYSYLSVSGVALFMKG